MHVGQAPESVGKTAQNVVSQGKLGGDALTSTGRQDFSSPT
jgi:hypothetical protein